MNIPNGYGEFDPVVSFEAVAHDGSVVAYLNMVNRTHCTSCRGNISKIY